jgi:lysophospholipase L1-like esterase
LNNAGYSLRDYSNVIMECAEKYGIVYYDLNASGVLNDDDMDDKLHPNSSGYAKIAQVFADFIIDNYHYYWQE